MVETRNSALIDLKAIKQFSCVVQPCECVSNYQRFCLASYELFPVSFMISTGLDIKNYKKMQNV